MLSVLSGFANSAAYIGGVVAAYTVPVNYVVTPALNRVEGGQLQILTKMYY